MAEPRQTGGTKPAKYHGGAGEVPGQEVQAGCVRVQGKGQRPWHGGGKWVVLAHPWLVSKRYCGILTGTALLLLQRTELFQSHVPEMRCWDSFIYKKLQMVKRLRWGGEQEGARLGKTGSTSELSSKGSDLHIAPNTFPAGRQPSISHVTSCSVTRPHPWAQMRKQPEVSHHWRRKSSKQVAACAASHPPFMSYSDPISSETEYSLD